MLSDLDWGSVPDYLPALTIVGGILIFLRELRRDRAARLEAAVREQQALELAAAAVGGTLIPPQRDERLVRGLDLTVRNYGTVPVFDVQADVRYVGVAELPAGLRHFSGRRTVLSAGDAFSVRSQFDAWPEGQQYSDSDFEWEATFRDVRGNKWRRGAWGAPVRQDVS